MGRSADTMIVYILCSFTVVGCPCADPINSVLPPELCAGAQCGRSSNTESDPVVFMQFVRTVELALGSQPCIQPCTGTGVVMLRPESEQ
jgi:hypothetical protein